MSLRYYVVSPPHKVIIIMMILCNLFLNIPLIVGVSVGGFVFLTVTIGVIVTFSCRVTARRRARTRSCAVVSTPASINDCQSTPLLAPDSQTSTYVSTDTAQQQVCQHKGLSILSKEVLIV